MPITVADVLALDVVQLGAPTVLCDVGLDRQVRWVHVSDVADVAHLISGGELVLTTGAGLYRSPGPYLRSLADVGAVGVIVEDLTPSAPSFGDDTAIADRSAELADAARSAGIALIVLSRQIRFVDVTPDPWAALPTARRSACAAVRRVRAERADPGRPHHWRRPGRRAATTSRWPATRRRSPGGGTSAGPPCMRSWRGSKISSTSISATARR